MPNQTFFYFFVFGWGGIVWLTLHDLVRAVSQFDMLEMDRLERQLVNLHLLQDPSSYIPDTVDLTEDAPAREYWLDCFEEALDGVRSHFQHNTQQHNSALSSPLSLATFSL